MRRLLFAAVAAALALSGCSATVTGSAGPTGATADGGTSATTTDPVAWTDKVCGSLLQVAQTLNATPPLNEGDAATTAKSLSGYLAKVEGAVDQALAGLDAAGPSPIAGGDAAVAQAKSALTTLRTSFDRAKTAIDKIDPTNGAEVAATFPTVLASLAELSKIPDSAVDVQQSPALKAAAAQAPNCQSLHKLS